MDVAKQLMTPEEEVSVVNLCFRMQRHGFPVRVYKVKIIAEGILALRIPDKKLGRGWLNGFYKRNPTVHTRYSSAIDYVRACKGNNFLIVQHFFTLVWSMDTGSQALVDPLIN